MILLSVRILNINTDYIVNNGRSIFYLKTYLMTPMPFWPAAATSMLSTPAPARPTTLSLDPASKTSLVTWDAERTTKAS